MGHTMKRNAVLLLCCLVLVGLWVNAAAGGSISTGGEPGALRIENVSTNELLPVQGNHAGNASGESDDNTLGMMLSIFLGGIMLNLTPCIYPLIPVTISYFGGRSSGGQEPQSMGAVAAHAVLYVIGLAVTNSMLGVVAALSGRMLGEVLQNPVTLVVVGVILVGFALSMFGFWEFRLPGVVTGAAAKNYAGYFGSIFIGLTVGLVAAPCVGPFVVGLLVWVATKGNPWFGFWVFLVLSLGMGVPLFVLAMLSGRISSLPKSGEWMLWVRKLMGWVLVLMAVYFIRPLFSEMFGNIILALTFVAAGVHLGWVDSTVAGFPAFHWIKKGAGICALLAAVTIVWPLVSAAEGIHWQRYSEKVFEDAKNSGKPIIVDFSADWCVPCREMEKRVFHDPAVVENASKYFAMIKVDLTEKANKETERMIHRFNIDGVPTVVFLKPGGEERQDLRVLELMPKGRFLARMDELRNSAGGTGK